MSRRRRSSTILMLERDGRNNLYVTLCNYEHGSLDSSLEMMRHAGAVLGLGDGGAHCGTDLRRQLSDVHADALGARPAARRATAARH